MVLVQQLGTVILSTFSDVSEYLLKRITYNQSSKYLYFVTDMYKENSIKEYKRKRRGVVGGSLRMSIQRRDQKRPSQWQKYLTSGENKTELIQFLFKDWSHESRFKDVIRNHVIFFLIENA